MSESEIPEIQREPAERLPIAAIIVIAILVIAGLGLVGFALFASQQDNENRSISGTVSAVLAFTSTPTNTRPFTNTPLPANTSKPTETLKPTNTPEPVKASDTPRPTNTRTRTSAPVATRVIPTDTPVPSPTAPPQPVGVRGVTGTFTLCAGKTQYAAKIERICFREFIKNNTDATIRYNYLGVRYTQIETGTVKMHPSWTGTLSLGPNCAGPMDTCGGAWEDGIANIETPGTYKLEMVMRFENDFDVIGSPITITIVNYTP